MWRQMGIGIGMGGCFDLRGGVGWMIHPLLTIFVQNASMSNYRRMRVEGATYFFTVSLADRGSSALVENIDVLREAYARTIAEQPVWSDAFVVLPDHLHAVWTLPEGDADFSNRWRKIKGNFRTH